MLAMSACPYYPNILSTDYHFCRLNARNKIRSTGGPERSSAAYEFSTSIRTEPYHPDVRVITLNAQFCISQLSIVYNTGLTPKIYTNRKCIQQHDVWRHLWLWSQHSTRCTYYLEESLIRVSELTIVVPGIDTNRPWATWPRWATTIRRHWTNWVSLPLPSVLEVKPPQASSLLVRGCRG